MPRFFLPADSCRGDLLTIEGEDARHIALSLRMREGEQLTVCDGVGNDLSCVITGMGKHTVTLRVAERRGSIAESACRITLFQCLPKGQKMEQILQKSVELGVAAVVPVLSERCVSRPERAEFAKKAERYEAVIREAAMQSGRGVLPVLHPLLSFPEAVERLAALSCGLVLYEAQSGSGFSPLLARAAEIGLLVGPEGGLAPEEVLLAQAGGIEIVGLGPRILRTETCGPAAIAVLQYITGNLQ